MAFEMDRDDEYLNEEDVKIVVFGVGGGGGNTIATMVEKEVGSVHYTIANTNIRDLDNKDKSKITTIHLARKVNDEQSQRIGDPVRSRRRGKVRGAGGDPKVGEACAKDTQELIVNELMDADMVFIAASMGGGTGTGAAPVIAEIARKMDILTVGVVTKPFRYEGADRMNTAIEGIKRMRENVDALIVIDDESVFRLPDNSNLDIQSVFKAVDDVLCKAVIGIINIINADGFINVDFADICAALENAGLAHMAIGHGKGERARQTAVDEVLHSPLLMTSIDGAKRGLINISIPRTFPINEYQQLASEIAMKFNTEARFKVGVVFDSSLQDDEIDIIAIATDFDKEIEDQVINDRSPALNTPEAFDNFFAQSTQNAFSGLGAGSFGSVLGGSADDPNRANALMNAMNAINGTKGR
ncbi:MAG: cell division protein FtsZ [Oscillospiraceae bacterium]